MLPYALRHKVAEQRRHRLARAAFLFRVPLYPIQVTPPVAYRLDRPIRSTRGALQACAQPPYRLVVKAVYLNLSIGKDRA